LFFGWDMPLLIIASIFGFFCNRGFKFLEIFAWPQKNHKKSYKKGLFFWPGFMHFLPGVFFIFAGVSDKFFLFYNLIFA